MGAIRAGFRTRITVEAVIAATIALSCALLAPSLSAIGRAWLGTGTVSLNAKAGGTGRVANHVTLARPVAIFAPSAIPGFPITRRVTVFRALLVAAIVISTFYTAFAFCSGRPRCTSVCTHAIAVAHVIEAVQGAVTARSVETLFALTTIAADFVTPAVTVRRTCGVAVV
jgi:hypothetical protein